MIDRGARVASVVFALCLLAAAAPIVAASTSRADLEGSIRGAIAASGLKKATISVSVRDADGTELAALSGTRPMIPASNLKLFTTGAALASLGPDFTFRTRLLRDGDRLVVVGDGDPAFGDPELLSGLVSVAADGTARRGLTVEDLLAGWADAVAATGVKQISAVVVDDRIFAREGVHPGWPADQLNEAYCAQVWGLNFHANLLHLFPTVAGGRGTIDRLVPAAPWVKLTTEATAKRGSKDAHTAWVARNSDGSFTLRGNVRTVGTDPIVITATDTPTFFARLLADRLARRGVLVGAAYAAGATDPAPKGATVGAVVQTPIATTITRANRDSENLYAECLLKRMAARDSGNSGSWSRGTQALRARIEARVGGPVAAGFVYSEGSGLSRANRITASGASAWIASVATDPTLGAPWLESMAVAGSTGTVNKRMKDLAPLGVTVRCKSGYINGTCCLSGVVSTSDGRAECFSILCNDLTETDAVGKAKRLQDRIVRLVAEDLQARGDRTRLGG